VVRSPETEEALVAAARLAAERRATIAVITVVELPLHLTEEQQLPELEREGHELLDSAQALVESYGVRAVSRLIRGAPGSAGGRIVEDARRRNADLIVLGEPRAGRRRGFGKTVDYVLREAPCPVLVAAGRKRAA
jgi:nucleotide-binding universal stress UspA family protein